MDCEASYLNHKDMEDSKTQTGNRLADRLHRLLVSVKKAQGVVEPQDLHRLNQCIAPGNSNSEFSGLFRESNTYQILKTVFRTLRADPTTRSFVIDHEDSGFTEDGMWLALPKWESSLGLPASIYWHVVTERIVERTVFRESFRKGFIDGWKVMEASGPRGTAIVMKQRGDHKDNNNNNNIKTNGQHYGALFSDEPRVVADFGLQTGRDLWDFAQNNNHTNNGVEPKLVIRLLRCAPRTSICDGIARVLNQERTDNIFDIWIRHPEPPVKMLSGFGNYLHAVESKVSLLEKLTDVVVLEASDGSVSIHQTVSPHDEYEVFSSESTDDGGDSPKRIVTVFQDASGLWKSALAEKLPLFQAAQGSKKPDENLATESESSHISSQDDEVQTGVTVDRVPANGSGTRSEQGDELNTAEQETSHGVNIRGHERHPPLSNSDQDQLKETSEPTMTTEPNNSFEEVASRMAKAELGALPGDHQEEKKDNIHDEDHPTEYLQGQTVSSAAAGSAGLVSPDVQGEGEGIARIPNATLDIIPPKWEALETDQNEVPKEVRIVALPPLAATGTISFDDEGAAEPPDAAAVSTADGEGVVPLPVKSKAVQEGTRSWNAVGQTSEREYSEEAEEDGHQPVADSAVLENEDFFIMWEDMALPPSAAVETTFLKAEDLGEVAQPTSSQTENVFRETKDPQKVKEEVRSPSPALNINSFKTDPPEQVERSNQASSADAQGTPFQLEGPKEFEVSQPNSAAVDTSNFEQEDFRNIEDITQSPSFAARGFAIDRKDLKEVDGVGQAPSASAEAIPSKTEDSVNVDAAVEPPSTAMEATPSETGNPKEGEVGQSPMTAAKCAISKNEDTKEAAMVSREDVQEVAQSSLGLSDNSPARNNASNNISQQAQLAGATAETITSSPVGTTPSDKEYPRNHGEVAQSPSVAAETASSSEREDFKEAATTSFKESAQPPRTLNDSPVTVHSQEESVEANDLAVTKRKKPRSLTMKCSSCQTRKRKTEFSKAQRRKNKTARCHDCEGTKEGAIASAIENALSEREDAQQVQEVAQSPLTCDPACSNEFESNDRSQQAQPPGAAAETINFETGDRKEMSNEAQSPSGTTETSPTPSVGQGVTKESFPDVEGAVQSPSSAVETTPSDKEYPRNDGEVVQSRSAAAETAPQGTEDPEEAATASSEEAAAQSQRTSNDSPVTVHSQEESVEANDLAVTKRKKARSPATVTMKCSKCQTRKPKTEFSKAQLRKKETARCHDCVATGQAARH